MIVPFKKPGKPDYHLAKWCWPISFHSTLGKALEAVLVEILLFTAEEHGLLPQDHSRARRMAVGRAGASAASEQKSGLVEEEANPQPQWLDIKSVHKGVSI